MTNNYLFDIFNLKKRVVILTGGLGKLGTQYTEALVKANAQVAIFDISNQENNHLKTLAKEFPIMFLKVDITKEKQVKSAFKKVSKKWGTPTILINNAGWKASPNKATKAGVPFEKYKSVMQKLKEQYRFKTSASLRAYYHIVYGLR